MVMDYIESYEQSLFLVEGVIQLCDVRIKLYWRRRIESETRRVEDAGLAVSHREIIGRILCSRRGYGLHRGWIFTTGIREDGCDIGRSQCGYTDNLLIRIISVGYREFYEALPKCGQWYSARSYW